MRITNFGSRCIDNVYADADNRVRQAAFPVTAVDTTGAGDTFVGYFLATWLAGADIPHCLARACRAAAICTTRKGAASSIPEGHEVDDDQPAD